MTSLTNGEHQELDKLTREELISQYEKKVSDMSQSNAELQTKNDELGLENQRLLILQSPFSPIRAQNLQPAMTSIAALDETKVQQMITTTILTLNSALESKLTQLLDSKISAFMHEQPTLTPIPATTPLGATVPNGIPGLLQSPLISNVLGGAIGNPTVVPNDYDKAVEVEQRKLCNPILTPPDIRAWKLVFDVYA